MASLLVWLSLKDAGRVREAPLSCATTVIVIVAQQGSKTKSLFASQRGGGPRRQGFLMCLLCFALSLSSSAVSRLGPTTKRDHIEHARTHHQPRAVVASYSRPFIFTTPQSETRFSLSTFELLPRLPFPVPTTMSCGNHTGSPAQRVVRSYFDLLSFRCQGGELWVATPDTSPPLPSHFCHVLQHLPMTHRRPKTQEEVILPDLLCRVDRAQASWYAVAPYWCACHHCSAT